MRYTRHAGERSQERGITESVIDLIIKYGTPRPQPDGTCKYRLQSQDKKVAANQLHQQLQHLDNATGKEVIVGDEEVITAYHKVD